MRNEEEECIHIPGVPRSQCTICNGRDKREEDAESEVVIITSKYSALCGGMDGCGLFYNVGDRVAWWPDGSHRTIHEDCYHSTDLYFQKEGLL